MDKAKILKEQLAPLFLKLNPEQKGKWGVMNAQQAVEHLSDYVRIASGKVIEKPVLTPEQTQKAYGFMMTDKPFRENTPNQLLSDTPPPVKHKNMQDAVAELQAEIDDLFAIYAKQPDLKVPSPFFGQLGFNEQVHLLHKHLTHHARQFGLVD